ncbi:MAG: helix-hairpin-helix domain-containing protein [Byssovorax sp.]
MNISRSEQGMGGAGEAIEHGRDQGQGAIAQARRWLTRSAFGALAGKALLYLGGFVLLALVGSGRVRWPAPPGKSAIGVAEAAAATPPSAAPSASASVIASASASASAVAPPAPPASGEAKAGPGKDEAKGADGADGGAPSGGVSADGKVILNLASEDDLRRLPGIGATRAKAILALRSRLGRFSRVEDLLKVKGIGRRSLARLRPLVRIDPAG